MSAIRCTCTWEILALEGLEQLWLRAKDGPDCQAHRKRMEMDPA